MSAELCETTGYDVVIIGMLMLTMLLIALTFAAAAVSREKIRNENRKDEI